MGYIKSNLITAEYGLDGAQDFNPSRRELLASTFARARSYNVLATIGDSRLQQGFVNNESYYANGVLAQARALLQGAINLAYQGGVSGNRTDQMKPRVQNAINSGAGTLFIWGGVNNIAQLYPTASTSGITAFNDIRDMSEEFRAVGGLVIVTTETPVTTGWTTQQFNNLHELNQRLTEYAYSTPGVLLFDMHSVVVDYSSATAGTVNSGYYSDATHVNILGAYKGGLKLANLLTSYLPAVFKRKRAGLQDEYANDQAEMLVNGNFMTTSGGAGSGSNGVTGTVPGSWTVTRSGTGVATVVSTEAASDGYGNACVLTSTLGNSGDTVRLQQDALLARIIVGERYVLTADVELSGGASVEGVYAYLEYNNGASKTLYDLFPQNLGGGIPDGETVKYSFRTAPITPSGTLAWFTNRIQLRYNANSGASTLKVSNMSTRRIYR